MLTIGIIALIQPIQPNSPFLPMSTAAFMVASALLLALLSRKGELNRKDGVLLLAIYIVFLTIQSMIEGFAI